MKKRIGFVSNSSSSSFVVAFPKKPKNIKELQEMMFGKQEWHYSDGYGKNTDIPTTDIAKAVFSEINNKKTASKKDVFESIRNGWFGYYINPELFPGHYLSQNSLKLTWDKDADKIKENWEKDDIKNDERAKNIANAFLAANKKKFIAVMSFSDNDGDFSSMLEHSDIFHRLEHIITSYH
jgi:hypothetical protein